MLDWYGETDPAMELRLANRLTGFWSVRGYFSEGRRRLGNLLERGPDGDPERMDAMNGAAWLATDRETVLRPSDCSTRASNALSRT